jgi:hypothetical protein
MINDDNGTEKSQQINATICPPQPVKSGQGTQEPDMRKTYHDFRSSLNIIIGYSELMLDGVMGKMTDEQREGMKDILTASFHMLDLVSEVSGRQSAIRS